MESNCLLLAYILVLTYCQPVTKMRLFIADVSLAILRKIRPGHKQSKERMFHGPFVPGNECPRELIVLRTNVPDTTTVLPDDAYFMTE